MGLFVPALYILFNTEQTVNLCVGAHTLYAQYMVTYQPLITARGCVCVSVCVCVCVCVCVWVFYMHLCVPRSVWICGQETHCMQIAIPLRVCPFWSCMRALVCVHRAGHLTWRFASPLAAWQLVVPGHGEYPCQVPHSTTLTSHGSRWLSHLQFWLF